MTQQEYTYSRHWAPDDFRRNYTLTVWGRGVTCRLDHGGRSVYWQGDEAVEVTQRVYRDGNTVLPAIWDEYEHVSEPDGED